VSQAGPEEILLAAIGLSETPRPPGPGVRERLFASRARSGKYGIFADRLARFFDLSLADAEALAQRLENSSTFTPFLVDGLELLPVTCGPKCDGAIATVVRIQPGARFPEHAHKGDESMVVLDGGFREVATEREVWRGEELFSPDGSEHVIEALPGVPCVAAVLIYGYADMK
jgi:putative transcriptional regulator